MRLLHVKDDGEFSLVEFFSNSIPLYAILSHTWGADDDEVSFKNIVKGRGKGKAGYDKLAFCAKQTASAGLRYFWIDTCCIDKSSSAELTEAINSMFRWYQNAARCYVYLADVSVGKGPPPQTWKQTFQQSRWFTRGWTLQELLAPKSVEFFSAEGERLGDKYSLIQEIYETTGISIQALQGGSLFQISVDERLSWAEKRETKREEDAAYSLLGLFDVHMPLIYGEGREKAFIRLDREIRRGSEHAMSLSTNRKPLPSQSSSHTGEIRYPLSDYSASTSSQDLAAVEVEKKQAMKAENERVIAIYEAREAAKADNERAMKAERERIIAEFVAREQREEIILQLKVEEEERKRKEKEEWERFLFKQKQKEEDSKAEYQNDNDLDMDMQNYDDMDMRMWWDEALSSTFNPPNSYQKVAVLLIKWANRLEAPEITEEVRELENVFHERFQFATTIISLDESQHQIDGHLSIFLDRYDGANNLLIIYYAGHSVYQTISGQLWLTMSTSYRLTSARKKPRNGGVNWSRTEEWLCSDEVDGDVLAILDTAYPRNLMRNRKRSTKKIEVLSACAVDEHTAYNPPKTTFTRTLIDALTNLTESGDNSFTTLRLNQVLTRERQKHGTSPQLWSMLQHNEGHIRLTPLKTKKDRKLKSPRSRGYLTLGFALQGGSLNREQIDFLTKNLAKALNNKVYIKLDTIDWLGFRSTQTTTLALATWAIERWKEFVTKRREKRAAGSIGE